MNKSYKSFVCAALITSLVFVGQARAQDGAGLGLAQVQQRAVASNPTLRATMLELKRAELSIVSAEGAWDPLWSMDAGYTYGSSIALGRDGSATLLSRESLQASAQVSKTFTTATQTRAQLGVGRAVSDSVAVGRLGAAYNMGLLLEVTQPWLRGFGKEITQGTLRSARSQRMASDLDKLTQANTLLREVTVAYWELWYAQRAVEVSEQALALAQEQLKIGQVRLDAGLLAKEELLPLLSEEASLKEQLISSKGQVRERAMTLGRLLGEPTNGALRASEAAPTDASMPAMDALMAQAKQRSPALLRLESEREVAKINAILAKDRARLDLSTVARLQVDGLGRDPAEALVSFGSFTAISGFVGLSLTWPASTQAALAESERAQLAIKAVDARYEAQLMSMERDLATGLNSLQIAYDRRALVEEASQLAQQTVQAQQVKLEAGDATALDVVRVLQRQREAQLRQVRLEADIAIAQANLSSVVGVLADGFALTMDEASSR